MLSLLLLATSLSGLLLPVHLLLQYASNLVIRSRINDLAFNKNALKLIVMPVNYKLCHVYILKAVIVTLHYEGLDLGQLPI